MTDDRPDMPHCSRCGDVKACLHRPDEVIQRAFENEMIRAEKEAER